MSTKTRRIVSLICFVLSVTGLLLLLSWFFVPGSSLRFLKELPTDAEILCTVQTYDYNTGDYKTEEFPLTQEQMGEIMTLMRKTAFWRLLSPSITQKEGAIYAIFCEFHQESRHEYVTVSVVGDYAVSIISSVEKFNQDGFLRILDKNFLSKLEAILAE